MTFKEHEWVLIETSKKSTTRRAFGRVNFLLAPFKSSAVFHQIISYSQIYDYFDDCLSVERRRRFNINDRIKELGGLLPAQVNYHWIADNLDG